MNTRQKLHQLRMNEWATRFSDQKASGLTVKEWCDQNDLYFTFFSQSEVLFLFSAPSLSVSFSLEFEKILFPPSIAEIERATGSKNLNIFSKKFKITIPSPTK